MIFFAEKCDIFDNEYIKQPYTLVNAVNCVGIMGKGIALEFKNRYPLMYKDYMEKCFRNEIALGTPYHYSDGKGTSIINFPTKYHWKDKSNFSDITKGLEIIVDKYKEWGIKRLAMPAIGCGLGGLDWFDVKKEINYKFKDLDVFVLVSTPF